MVFDLVRDRTSRTLPFKLEFTQLQVTQLRSRGGIKESIGETDDGIFAFTEQCEAVKDRSVIAKSQISITLPSSSISSGGICKKKLFVFNLVNRWKYLAAFKSKSMIANQLQHYKYHYLENNARDNLDYTRWCHIFQLIEHSIALRENHHPPLWECSRKTHVPKQTLSFRKGKLGIVSSETCSKSTDYTYKTFDLKKTGASHTCLTNASMLKWYDYVITILW